MNSNQRVKKKISIELLQLPKLRHKSTHQFNSKLKKNFQCRSSFQRKSQPYHFRKPNHLKTRSKIQEQLSKQRLQFRQLTNININLLNETFFKLDSKHRQFQTKKKLQKRKVFNMEKQQFLSMHRKSGVAKNELNLNKISQQLYTGPMIVLDYKIQMSFLNHACYDGQFPLTRVGSTLSYHDDAIYLFGGCPDSSQSNLAFHKFKLIANEWKHIDSSGQKPMFSLIYHTANSYKDYLIFTGGMSIERLQIKKFNNSHINIFSTVSQIWTQFNWGYYLKHHSSCMINNTLIIHGGINEREKTQKIIHFVHLNLNNLHFSKVVSFGSSQYLSHHKMITTINEDGRLRSKFKIDGLIIFGGKKNACQKLSNQLYYIETSSFKLSDDDTSMIKKWQCVQIKGPKPEARMCHTFDLLQNKGLCVLIGGINQKNQYLNDMWIFDLFGLSWTQVEQVPLLHQTGGIAYHSSIVDESEIYLYGGITKQRDSKQFYLIQTQKFKRQYSRHQSRRRLDISSNMISFKAFQ